LSWQVIGGESEQIVKTGLYFITEKECAVVLRQLNSFLWAMENLSGFWPGEGHYGSRLMTYQHGCIEPEKTWNLTRLEVTDTEHVQTQAVVSEEAVSRNNSSA
jgi:hypothetical protein